ncbi:spore germination protein [Paenibacillus sp. TRM 82003]|nr:spore germination protein [Paenibacillus sp. TRM 82003]
MDNRTFRKYKKPKVVLKQSSPPESPEPPRSGSLEKKGGPLRSSLDENLAYFEQRLNEPADLLVRRFYVGPLRFPCAVVCIDGLVDKVVVNDQLIRGALEAGRRIGTSEAAELTGADWIDRLEAEALPVNEAERASTLDDVMKAVLSGDTAFLVDGAVDAIVVGTRGWETRSLDEPSTESVVRGPKEGFVETIRVNTALIRRQIRDPSLRMDYLSVGRRSKRDVYVVYLDGIVHPPLVEEVKRRIASIDVDDPGGSGFIEQWISDDFLSPFPQVLGTERPDNVVNAVYQGKVAVLVDGTPFQLVLPVTLGSGFQSPEDYYLNWHISTLVRSLRMVAAFIATFLPAIYIALVEFHHGLIPSKLAFSIAGAREGVPFPAVVEAFMMEITLELLREAGIRLPKPIGPTIGIVGGLVIGESAVAAGIVSPVMVIVVAVTAIASFALPAYSFAISLRMIRFGIMLTAAVFGLYGLVLSYILLNIHLVNLSSFGVPYLTPYAPFFGKDWKDLVLRAPHTALEKRPEVMKPEDSDRMG